MDEVSLKYLDKFVALYFSGSCSKWKVIYIYGHYVKRMSGKDWHKGTKWIYQPETKICIINHCQVPGNLPASDHLNFWHSRKKITIIRQFLLLHLYHNSWKTWIRFTFVLISQCALVWLHWWLIARICSVSADGVPIIKYFNYHLWF